MEHAAREMTLSNGLTVRFTHKARRYFGDYHEVTLEVESEVPVTREMFDDEAAYGAALARLGATVRYRRVEEQMGIPTAAVEECAQKLVERFSATALPYFESPHFPRKIVHAELARASRPQRTFIPMHSND